MSNTENLVSLVHRLRDATIALSHLLHHTDSIDDRVARSLTSELSQLECEIARMANAITVELFNRRAS